MRGHPMSGQRLDAARSARILRRHKILVGIAVILGIGVGGAAHAVLSPPMFTSTALVVLPQSTQAQQGAAIAGEDAVNPYTATQQLILTSKIVLLDALPQVRPGMSVDQLRRDISVGSPTPYVLSVSAEGQAAADAERAANAVARSYISYIGSASSPVGPVQAQLFEPATSATGAPLKPLVIDALAGAVSGAVIGVIIALAIGRNDRRLRERNEIADSIGVPVLASVCADYPTDAPGWLKLLLEYDPGAVDAWQLRRALYQLGLIGGNPSDPQAGRGSSIAVLSLSTDRKALALGPQLAAFAATAGIPTALVIGPGQDANVAATLHTACAVGFGSVPPKISRYLRVAVSNDAQAGQLPGIALVVVVAIVDGQAPRVADTMRATATVLGVSAGAATADQLARIAVSAATDGREIAGILVADPDVADRTTGRVPQVARPGLRAMPTRITGTATEMRR
jgi:capsular polysaccharide biosynthesis protein